MDGALQVQRARLSKRVTFADGTLVHYSEGSQGTLTALRPLQPELGAQFRLALLMYLHRLAPSAASHVTDGKKVSFEEMPLVGGLEIRLAC